MTLECDLGKFLEHQEEEWAERKFRELQKNPPKNDLARSRFEYAEYAANDEDWEKVARILKGDRDHECGYLRFQYELDREAAHVASLSPAAAADHALRKEAKNARSNRTSYTKGILLVSSSLDIYENIFVPTYIAARQQGKTAAEADAIAHDRALPAVKADARIHTRHQRKEASKDLIKALVSYSALGAIAYGAYLYLF